MKDFIDTHGIRPTALEAYRDGYAPRSVRKNYGSWFGFLQSIDALDSDDTQAAGACSAFLESLEVDADDSQLQDGDAASHAQCRSIPRRN